MRPEFETREDSQRDVQVTVGCWVKFGACGERFWCHVLRRSGDALTAVVDNELHKDAPLRYGDVIELHTRNVLESVSESEARTFNELVVALGDEDEAAMKWRQSRIDAGVAATGSATWLALPSGKRRARACS